MFRVVRTGTILQPTSPAASALRKGDVVMKVDGIKVANDGSIPFRSGERVALRYYMSQLFAGDKARGLGWGYRSYRGSCRSFRGSCPRLLQ